MTSSQPLEIPSLDLVTPAPPSANRITRLYPSKEFVRPIPFFDFVRAMPPTELESDALASGLAAVFTTQIDNPVFRLPTKQDESNGALPASFAMYAPYYLGTGLTPEEIATDIARQGAIYLKQLDAAHGYDGYVGRLLSVLRNGRIAHEGLQVVEDRNILFDAHDFMASTTRRLHHLAPLEVVGGRPLSAAAEYRAGTHEKVDPYVDTLVYEAAADGLRERFSLPEFIRSDPAQHVSLGWDFFGSGALRRGAEFAALAAEKVGDPVVRGSLSEHYLPPHMRSREYLLAAQ